MSTRKTAATKPDPSTEERPNALVEAADDAQRKLLLSAWKRAKWNLAHTATSLRLHGASAVIRYLKRLAPKEYAAAKKDGRIVAGARAK